MSDEKNDLIAPVTCCADDGFQQHGICDYCRGTLDGVEADVQYRDASVGSLHQTVYSFSVTLLQENLVESKK